MAMPRAAAISGAPGLLIGSESVDRPRAVRPGASVGPAVLADEAWLPSRFRRAIRHSRLRCSCGMTRGY